MFEQIAWDTSSYMSLWPVLFLLVSIPLGGLDFINNMENGDLQRRLEFPVVGWEKLVWYHMTCWIEFKYT